MVCCCEVPLTFQTVSQLKTFACFRHLQLHFSLQAGEVLEGYLKFKHLVSVFHHLESVML